MRLRCLSLLLLISLLASTLPTLVEAQTRGTVFSIIIENGMVYDGLGNEPVQTDIGVIGDAIVALGDLSSRRAAQRIDASNLAVVPGFVDIHSHADRTIFDIPMAENYIRQGVTTAIGGPDGSSLYPIGETLHKFSVQPATINFGSLVGHGTIRRQVMGNENRAPTEAEMEQMKRLVDAAMQEGAFGLSSGLKYVPGAYAETEEVIELAEVAGLYGGFYKSHMRDEGLELLASVQETIRIGGEGRLPTQLTHHKVIGKSMWGASMETLNMVDEAVSQGIDVTIDQYPYIASSTGLTVLFPSWSLEGNQADLLGRLNNPEARARIKEAIVFNLEKDRGGGDPANVAIAYCAWDTTLNGKNLAIILEERDQEVTVDAAAELALELQEKGGFMGIFFAMTEEDVERIMQHPLTMVSSDGGIPHFGLGVPHPRNYGTFSRVLGHYVRQRNLMSFEEAIRKMTSLPAQRLGLTDRGFIATGAKADIAIMDLTTVIDKATFAEPHQYAEGVHHVFVNGQAVMLDGTLTGTRPGVALRRR